MYSYWVVFFLRGHNRSRFPAISKIAHHLKINVHIIVVLYNISIYMGLKRLKPTVKNERLKTNIFIKYTSPLKRTGHLQGTSSSLHLIPTDARANSSDMKWEMSNSTGPLERKVTPKETSSLPRNISLLTHLSLWLSLGGYLSPPLSLSLSPSPSLSHPSPPPLSFAHPETSFGLPWMLADRSLQRWTIGEAWI